MADQTTPAPSTNTSAGGDQSEHTPLTYRVEMTMAWFRDVYKQQNMAYYRKMGIFCLVFGIPLTLVSLYILISDPSETTLESIGAIALFGALSVMGVMMMQGKGIMMRTRKGELSSFFATHGMPDPHGPYSLEDLHCEYDVTVRDLGFEEAVTFENGLKLVTKQPWVVLTGKGGEAQGAIPSPRTMARTRRSGTTCWASTRSSARAWSPRRSWCRAPSRIRTRGSWPGSRTPSRASAPRSRARTAALTS